MEGRVIARVAIEKSTLRFDKLFDYVVPEDMISLIKPGCRVLVPFGRSNQKMQALVFSLTDRSDYERGCKAVYSLLDKEPLIDREGFQMIEYLKQNTFCTYYDAVKVLLPVGFNVDVISTYHLSRKIDEIELDRFSLSEQHVIAYLKTARNKSELEQFIKTSLGGKKEKILEALIEKGVVVPEERAKRRVGDETIRMVRLVEDNNWDEFRLSPRQQTVVDLLKDTQVASVKECCYLCGVTEAVLKTLSKKGVLEYYDRQVFRRPKITVGSVKMRLPLSFRRNSLRYFPDYMSFTGRESRTLLY